jgi:hypothetical protein
VVTVFATKIICSDWKPLYWRRFGRSPTGAHLSFRRQELNLGLRAALKNGYSGVSTKITYEMQSLLAPNRKDRIPRCLRARKHKNSCFKTSITVATISCVETIWALIPAILEKEALDVYLRNGVAV